MAELNAKFSIEQKRLRVAFNLEQTTIPAIFKINAAGTTWGSISGNIQNQTDLINALNDKQDVLTAGENVQIEDNVISATDTTYTAGQGIDITNGVISNTQTSAEWGNIQGDISDQIDLVNALNEKQNTISDLSTIRENASEGASAYSTIQTYGDIVTHDAADFATAAQGDLADTALQPGDDISELNNDVGYITSASLPTVNDGSLTIQKNGSNIVVFTANDSQNKTANITVPTQASDIGALPDSTTIADLTTQTQLDAINSGATATNIGQITTNENDIADIKDLIPTQATSTNQLADKSFVNSSIATNTANFIGTFNSVAELEAYSGLLTNNDYAFVATTDSVGNTLYDRYKYNADTQQWMFEYELNNSSFTASQWAAINSGITSGDVSLIQSALQPNDNITELTNNAGYITGITSSDVTTALGYTPYDSSNPSGYTSNVGTVTSVNNISPDGNGNVTLTASDVGAATTADLAGKVSKTGDTMTGQLKINRATGSNFVEMQSGMVQRGIKPTSMITLGFMQVSDKNGQWLGKNQFQYTTTGEAKMELSARSVTSETIAKLSVGFDSSNRAFASAPATSTARTNSTDIITRGFLNSQGYITGITSSDVTNALGYTPLSNATKYGSSLSYSSNVLQLLDQDGNALGGSVTIQSSPDIDNKSITTNLSDELQTVGVIDQNNTTNAIKTWTGTKAQYDAIVTKDANTLYICANGEIYLGTTLISNDGANKSLSNLDATGQAVIDGKADVDLSNCTRPHIVEAYVNGTSGYNLYSNDYCEQWGSLPSGTSVTYLKTFRDTNYICQVQIINPNSTTATNEGAWIIKSVSTTGFTKITTGTQYLPSGTWKACGYLA